MSILRDNEERRLQMCFRIGEKTWERLVQVARLARMRESEYCKFVLMRDLNVLSEPLDKRRQPWRLKRKQVAKKKEPVEGEECNDHQQP